VKKDFFESFLSVLAPTVGLKGGHLVVAWHATCYSKENSAWNCLEQVSTRETQQEVFKVKERLTITEVAEEIGVTPKTLARWERTGKIRPPKRDWRGWRVYSREDLEAIKDFHEALF
jgi:hypothetical protein